MVCERCFPRRLHMASRARHSNSDCFFSDNTGLCMYICMYVLSAKLSYWCACVRARAMHGTCTCLFQVAPLDEERKGTSDDDLQRCASAGTTTSETERRAQQVIFVLLVVLVVLVVLFVLVVLVSHLRQSAGLGR